MSICTDYWSAQMVTIALPAATKTASTVLRWRQLSNSGYGLDEWAIDHVRITGVSESQAHVVSKYVLSEDFYPSPIFG